MLMFTDREINLQFVRRAEASGYQALVLTVDAHVNGRRLSYLRKDTSSDLAQHCKFPNFDNDNITGSKSSRNFVAVTKRMREIDTDWSVIAWLRSVTNLPIIVKGILTAEDATIAMEHGVAGIIVSNHGGRQLDTVPASVLSCVCFLVTVSPIRSSFSSFVNFFYVCLY